MTTSNIPFLPQRITGLLLFLLLAGCGSSPTVQFYALKPEPASSSIRSNAISPETAKMAIKVGPADFPRALARSQIVTRSSDTQVKVDEYHVWSAPLENEFLRVLGDSLAKALETDRMVVYPAESAFPIDYTVLLNVVQFDGRLGQDVTLRLRWVIADSKGVAAGVGGFESSRNLSTDSYDALVAAHSALVVEFSQMLARKIETLAQASANPAH